MMLSVVIIAYNEQLHIAACLEALEKQNTKEPFEVILVDNASTDRTVEIAESFAGKLNLQIVREEKKGRGSARSTGFKAAKGGIIFSTDADTEVPPNWIEAFVEEFQKNPKTVAVTGTYRINDCSGFTNLVFNVIQPSVMVLYSILMRHYWLTGGNFAIRRTAYEQAGGFDRQTSSAEDSDLAFRVRRIGTIQFVHNVPVLSSGRRFRHSISSGIYDYVRSWGQKTILKKQDAHLPDVR